MSDCKFCEALQTWKNINDFNDEKDKQKGEERHYHEYTVAIIERSWRKGNKRRACRITDYRNQGIGYKLNYCPECGVKL